MTFYLDKFQPHTPKCIYFGIRDQTQWVLSCLHFHFWDKVFFPGWPWSCLSASWVAEITSMCYQIKPSCSLPSAVFEKVSSVLRVYFSFKVLLLRLLLEAVCPRFLGWVFCSPSLLPRYLFYRLIELSDHSLRLERDEKQVCCFFVLFCFWFFWYPESN